MIEIEIDYDEDKEEEEEEVSTPTAVKTNSPASLGWLINNIDLAQSHRSHNHSERLTSREGACAREVVLMWFLCVWWLVED